MHVEVERCCGSVGDSELTISYVRDRVTSLCVAGRLYAHRRIASTCGKKDNVTRGYSININTSPGNK